MARGEGVWMGHGTAMSHLRASAGATITYGRVMLRSGKIMTKSSAITIDYRSQWQD